MAVFRIEKTRDYTVMSNHHLRDMSLSLKAKGLLSLMLSLPENWDYTMKGLSRICKDGIDSISGGIRELEEHGYLIRERVRGANGQLGSIEYTILEQPKEPTPAQEKPIRENPVQANPTLVTPVQEEPAQLNKEKSSNYPSRTDLSSTELSNPIQSNPPTPTGARMGTDRMRARECYREVILDIQLSDNLLNVTWLKSVLAYIGFPQAGFSSTDYFPLLPWIFLFATGYFLYSFLQEKGLINRLFGKWKVPGINFLGKHSLIIYMIHQPICYVVAFLVSEIF